MYGCTVHASQLEALQVATTLVCFHADSMLTVAVYEMTGILPTDPGYGYYRDHVQMFDPGWKGYQTKGPEDWNFDVFDKGNDPEGVLQRFPSTFVTD